MTIQAGFRKRLAVLPEKEQRGSRARCLRLTDGSDEGVASELTKLGAPSISIDPDRHFWLPKGLAAPREAKLGDESNLLPDHLRSELVKWWLAVPVGANTPNWDIAATCTVDKRQGLLLVEAKAHSNELHTAGCTSKRTENQRSIATAMAEANVGLLRVSSGWGLRFDSHFQLCNRFAFAWKLASMGIPVVLAYLGFLNASDMADRGAPFSSADAWRNAVIAHATGFVPETAWDATLDVHGTPVTALIRSVELDLE